jgi:hypothetical protein
MEIKMEIPQYDEAIGLVSYWEYGFQIKTEQSQGEILISANSAGLISLAVRLLTLAQEAVPAGHHYHFDEYNSLEEGSTALIIQKI